MTPFTFAGVQGTSGSYKLNLYSGIHAQAMSASLAFCDVLPGCDYAAKEENKRISSASKGKKKNLYVVILHIDYPLARHMHC